LRGQGFFLPNTKYIAENNQIPKTKGEYRFASINSRDGASTITRIARKENNLATNFFNKLKN